MKCIEILVLAPLLMAFQCDSDDPLPEDSLSATGLIGRWEIQSEISNGAIGDLLPKCCEFLEFGLDDNSIDDKGSLSYTDAIGLVNTGTFEVDFNNQTVVFIDDDADVFIFEFSVDDAQEYLTINFTEEETNYSQDWVRVD